MRVFLWCFSSCRNFSTVVEFHLPSVFPGSICREEVSLLGDGLLRLGRSQSENPARSQAKCVHGAKRVMVLESGSCLYAFAKRCWWIDDTAGKLFKEQTIMDWFVQMALALHYMHARKILHRYSLSLSAHNDQLPTSEMTS